MKRNFRAVFIFAGIILMILAHFLSPVYAEEPMDLEEPDEEIAEIVEDQLDKIDLSDIQTYWEKLVREYGGFLPETVKGSLKDYIKSSGGFSFGDWGKGLLEFIFHELFANGRLLGSLIMLTIFSMFLQALQNSFEKSTISKIAYAIVFMVLLIIALNSFHVAMQYARESIETMIHYTIAFIPLLLALIAAGGGIVSAGFFHPVILFLANISGLIINRIVLPLLFFSALLSIVSTMTDHYKATQLAGLLRNWSIGILGVFMTIFLSIVSIQGAGSAVADGVAIRTVKFVTGNFIPVVGRMFTDATDTVISASVLLKNTIGIAGVGILLLIILFPAVKIFIIAFIYKLSAALLQPLGGGPIITCLEIISKSVIYIFAALGIVAIMFFLSMTVIIVAGNLTLMVR